MGKRDFVKGFTFQVREKRSIALKKMRVIDANHPRYCVVEDLQIGCKETFLWPDLLNNISSDYEFILPPVKAKKITA